MKMTKEDLLKIREIASESGVEMTPMQILELIKKARPDIEIKDEPGLVTWLRQHGDNSTS